MTIALSACLLGEKVRFDGGHKRDTFITEHLKHYASFIPFCPEALAFGAPRPSIRFVQEEDQPQIISNKTGEPLTQYLEEANTHELTRLLKEPLTGIIFKSKSPSCGLGSAKVYLPNGQSHGKTDGLFATMLKAHFPLLPMEEEGRLQDPWLRENFIMQLFAYERFERMKQHTPTMKTLIHFHTAEKFLLQSKQETLYRKLGTIVANHDQLPFENLFAAYEQTYKETLAIKSSLGKTRNVLEHMAGFVKKELHTNEKAMLHQLIDDFYHGIIPLITPMSILQMLAQKYESAYLLNQTFLSPYPKELALRSSLKSFK